MRLVVTGGAGFLGSHLCDRLTAAGHVVLCVDNLLTGARENIQALLKNSQFEFLEADVSRPLFIDGPVDGIFHFASPASPIDYLNYPIQTLKVGALGTHNTLGLAKAKGAKFLLASTSEVYGDPQVHPQPEIYWGHVNPVGPRGVYDEAKRFAEAMTMAYHRVHKLNTRIIRIFNTYGPRMRMKDGRAIPAFITEALRGEPITIHGDGSQTRSFCYVSDLVDGILKLMDSDQHDPVNIGNPNEMTIKEIAQEIVTLTKSRSPVVYTERPVDDPARRRPDITLAKKQLDWEPRISLQEGLRETIQWFRQKLVAA